MSSEHASSHPKATVACIQVVCAHSSLFSSGLTVLTWYPELPRAIIVCIHRFNVAIWSMSQGARFEANNNLNF